MLGLVDHPVGIAKHRLAFTSIQGDISPPFVADADTQHVWTDGSVFLAESYWLTTAAYSIIDAFGRTVDTGPVQSPKLTSYSAELFAIYKATALSSAAIVIHTDCKSIVDQFHQLLLHREPLDSVCHIFWWRALWTIAERRQRQHPQPVKLVWVPAHIADDRADSEITDQYAAEHNTTRLDILLNREADRVAKDTAMQNAPVFPEDFQHLRKKVFDRQIFLARWNRTIGSDFIKDDEPTPNIGGADPAPVDLRSRFPRWDWIQDPSLFQWTSNLRIEQPRGSLGKLDPVL